MSQNKHIGFWQQLNHNKKRKETERKIAEPPGSDSLPLSSRMLTGDKKAKGSFSGISQKRHSQDSGERGAGTLTCMHHCTCPYTPMFACVHMHTQ